MNRPEKRIIRNRQPKGKPWLIVQGHIEMVEKFVVDDTLSRHDTKEDAEKELGK